MSLDFLKGNNLKEALPGFSHLPFTRNRLITGLATLAVRRRQEEGTRKE